MIFCPMTSTKCKKHISICSVALVCLWLCSVDPFSCARIVGYRKISMPTKSGCFLFKWEILHEMPRLCSCLALAHSSRRFSVSPRSYAEATLMLCFGSHQKERVLHVIAGGKLLAPSCIYSDLLILSPFCQHCPLNFEFPSTVTKADNFRAHKSSWRQKKKKKS